METPKNKGFEERDLRYDVRLFKEGGPSRSKLTRSIADMVLNDLPPLMGLTFTQSFGHEDL
jgi:hypothetical protein